MITTSPLGLAASAVIAVGGVVAAASLSRAAHAEAELLGRLGCRRGRPVTTFAPRTWRFPDPIRRVVALVRTAHHRDQLARALPDLLERTAWEVRAGAVMVDALRAACRRGPSALSHGLGPAIEQVDAGVPLSAALAAWAKRSGTREAIQVAAGLQLAIEAGGPQVAAIENLASSLRERLAVTKEAHALATQARASAVVIAAAPVLFGLLLGLGDRRASAFLFGSGSGLACLAGGLALDGLGAWWMWRITRSVR